MYWPSLPRPLRSWAVLFRFEYYTLGTAPLYGLIRPEKFEENGEYKIVVKLYAETYDAWGNMEPVEKWPVLQEEFSFMFNTKDVPMLLKNKEAADDVIEKMLLKKVNCTEVISKQKFRKAKFCLVWRVSYFLK